MGYVAARGGLDAIRAAEDLVREKRLRGTSPWLEIEQLTERLRYSVDRVMGEGGLWDEQVSARALRQAEGDLIEASHLVRSHRSRLPRFGSTAAISADEIEIMRRVVPAFRQPEGPQLLGRTVDYTGRLLEQLDEDTARADSIAAGFDPDRKGSAVEDLDRNGSPATDADAGQPTNGARRPRRLLKMLRDLDLLVDRRRSDDPEPYDVTRNPVRPGVPRSARLSVMARAETGALVNLWYRNILGPDNHLHEVTLGEVRHGRLPVRVVHPHTGNEVSIGEVRVTEVEAIEDLDGLEEDRTRFDIGYGLCFGHNERKAIAMANLDIALHRDLGDGSSGGLEQSLLMTTDGLDASGFLEHLKLPHYVTFRSMVERKLAMRRPEAHERRSTVHGLGGDLPITSPEEATCR
jgi:alpha-D-ribose 1-methylphosphonate 5-triphosphate synthase subunit PhnI